MPRPELVPFTRWERGCRVGVDVIGLQFLAYARRKRDFGRAVTVGRQQVDIDPPAQKKLARDLRLGPYDVHQKYAESLLIQGFGSACAESMDHSSYEGATIIQDLNLPFTKPPPTFDTVIDCGTLEHVFNIPQALANLSELCAESGQILHVVPAANFLGHGLYQFSPELFFSYYSEKNGYRDTEVYLANTTPQAYWYRAFPSKNGERHEMLTRSQFLICVRTTKNKTAAATKEVQQSDYLHSWARGPGSNDSRIKKALRNSPALYYALKKTLRVLKRAKRFAWPREIVYVHARPSRLQKVQLRSLLR